MFALRGVNDVETRKSSPSTGKMTPNWRFMARWASIFAETRLEGGVQGEFYGVSPERRPRQAQFHSE